MSFQPAFCPRKECPSHHGTPFSYRMCGFFRRRCDQKSVQRFLCLVCAIGFSEQTFRLNYRLKRPDLLPRFFLDRVSKVTHRQSARNHACSRTTEERHFRRLSDHCKAFHDLRIDEVVKRGGLGEVFLLDELETYEHHRIQKPLTVPVLIEGKSGFVVDVRVGTMAPRGRREEAEQDQDESESQPEDKPEPRRKSQSRAMVKAAFLRLRSVSPKTGPIRVLTDEKLTYATLLEEIFGKDCDHQRTPSTDERDTRNPLWPINHTMARMRDNVSRLVRETWAASKLARGLEGHLAIWVCYRNYVRGRTNRQTKVTPAMALGAQAERWTVGGLLEWRVFPGR